MKIDGTSISEKGRIDKRGETQAQKRPLHEIKTL